MLESGQVIKRELTPEEVQILLDHPECVMFNHWKAMKTHRFSLLQALIPAALAILLIVGFMLLFPMAAVQHPNITIAVSMIFFFGCVAALPINKGDELVIIYEEEYKKDQFFGLVKKDPATMSLYDSSRS